jgi:hypothetical protein
MDSSDLTGSGQVQRFSINFDDIGEDLNIPDFIKEHSTTLRFPEKVSRWQAVTNAYIMLRRRTISLKAIRYLCPSSLLVMRFREANVIAGRRREAVRQTRKEFS